MQNFFFLFLLMYAACFSTFAQNNQKQDTIYVFVQQKATPKEGMAVFYKNFAAAFELPEFPSDVNEVKLRLRFVVEKDGSFSNFEVLDGQYGLDELVITTMKKMPAWTPAMHNGKNVRSYFTLPIKINVNNLRSNVLSKSSAKDFLNSLDSNEINTPLFDLKCNCDMVRSSKNDFLHTEEFVLHTQDETGIYNIIFKKVDRKQAEEELKTIGLTAKNENAVVKSFDFSGVRATEIIFNMTENEVVNQYRTFFLYKNEYLIGVSVVSYNEKLADLLFQHLKKNLKLKV